MADIKLTLSSVNTDEQLLATPGGDFVGTPSGDLISVGTQYNVVADEAGLWDIEIANGQIVRDEGFDSSLILSLFADARASASEVAIPEQRRGSWQNELSNVAGHQVGSTLWLLQQSRLTIATKNEALQSVKKGLIWLVEDGHLKGVNVSGDIDGGTLNIQIDLVGHDGITQTRSFNLWENTDFNNKQL